jgi:ATPase subunit of ABC transporter with duplicated ATPase domains
MLDESTNNLDLTNVEFLEKLATAFRGAIILISHDEIFLKKCRVDQDLLIKGQEAQSLAVI